MMISVTSLRCLQRLAAFSTVMLFSHLAAAQVVSIPLSDSDKPVDSPNPMNLPQSPTTPPVSDLPVVPETQNNPVAAAPSVAPNLQGYPEAAVASPRADDPVIPGMTPDEVARMRQNYEDFAARNPKAAGNGPFAMLMTLRPRRELQERISKSVRANCKLSYFNVLIPFDMPLDRITFANLRTDGAEKIIRTLGTLCRDKEMLKGMVFGIGMFNIVNQKGQALPVVEGGQMSMTLRYDFSSSEPMNETVLRNQFAKALGVAQETTAKILKEKTFTDQDGMYEAFAKQFGFSEKGADLFK